MNVRIFHMRAPMRIRNFLGKRELPSSFLAGQFDQNGGATVVLTQDPAEPHKVLMQVGWCRWTDNYCRKLGVATAKKADVESFPLRDVPRILAEIEDQMLCHFHHELRNNMELRSQMERNWDFALRYFLPRAPKV